MTSRLRVTALIAAAALALHQLRYLLAPGHSEPAAGHSYLPIVGIAAALLLAAACAQLLRLVVARSGDGTTVRPLAFSRAWPLAALALFAVFLGQELLEGSLSAGRPGGAAAVFAAGGWIAIPLALALGALVAAMLAGARAVVRAVVARRPPPLARRRARGRMMLPRAHPAVSAPLAANLAGRAPPVAS